MLLQRKRSSPWLVQTLGNRLAMWLDALDQGTLSIATGVSQWRDKGPSGRHVAQATGAAQPAWSATGLDGTSKPGITFDATDDVLISLTTSLYAAGQAIIYMVLRVPSAATSRFLFSEASNSSANPSYSLRHGVTTGSSLAALLRNDANSVLVSNTVLATTVLNTSVAIVGVLDDGANLTARINGTAGTPVAYTRSGVVTPTQTAVGAFASTTTTNFSGASFGEIITCNALLTTGEAQQLEGYLAHRWSLQANLPVTHPFASARAYG